MRLPHLVADPEIVEQRYDRLPFPFEHNLSGLDLFHFDSLCALAGKFEDDFFVAASAPSPRTVFYSVPESRHSPRAAMERLDSLKQRVLLKRPERYDNRFEELLHTLFEQILELHPSLKTERIVRLASAVFITSAATVTPFHFDPETTFFFQIAGDKIYHLYSPTVLTEAELEGFYKGGRLDIGQVALDGRDPHREHVFPLSEGKGMHQPQNSPHWVATSESRSISYTISYETDAMRSRGRTRAFNYYLRQAGLTPSLPDVNPALDRAKATAMRYAIPLRRAVGKIVRPGERHA